MASASLPRLGILTHLDEESLQALTGYGMSTPIPADGVLINEGADQKRLFIVISGALEVVAKADDKQVHLAKLEPGDCFGEVSIFQPAPASATVRSTAPSQVWYMDSDQMQAFIHDRPSGGAALLWGITTILSQRLQQTNQIVKSHNIVPGFLSIRSKRRDTKRLPKISSSPDT
jgi:CRP/FNR family cyclic AMP-dependent transcriptional regulator